MPIEANYDEAGTCAYCGWNSAYMHSHAASAAWDGCAYMDSRYDITTEDGEVQCVEQAWYAARLEKKAVALHDKEMPWRELLERISSDAELCYLDDWSNKPPRVAQLGNSTNQKRVTNQPTNPTTDQSTNPYVTDGLVVQRNTHSHAMYCLCLTFSVRNWYGFGYGFLYGIPYVI